MSDTFHKNPSLSVVMIVFAIVASTTATVRAATPSFTGIGQLPSGTSSAANGISADGSIVVGSGTSHNYSPGYYRAVKWTPESGLSLLPVAGSQNTSEHVGAFAVDGTGDVIAGYHSIILYDIAARWTSSGVSIASNSGIEAWSYGYGISKDGSTIVGTRYAWRDYTNPPSYVGAAEYWLSGTSAPQYLPGYNGVGNYRDAAFDASADGSLIVGSIKEPTRYEGVYWNRSTGVMTPLGDLFNLGYTSSANAISDDGSVIAGYSASPYGVYATRWTQAGGMQSIGELTGGIIDSRAYGITGDGSVIVGSSYDADGRQAFIWDADHNMRGLKDLLVNKYGLTNLTGWTLTEAKGISDDGMTIVGNGTNPSGIPEGWVATIPEPTTIGLLTMALTIARRLRRVPLVAHPSA